ncbi:nucleotidyl transferase AbiEii/AbiGii toxin family protein [Modestobacter lapidis]
MFIGGTALSRTFLPHLRLSEDIDLITSAPRRDVGRSIESAVAAGLRRTHGSVAWAPALADTRGADSSVLVVGDSIHIRVRGGRPAVDVLASSHGGRVARRPGSSGTHRSRCGRGTERGRRPLGPRRVLPRRLTTTGPACSPSH